MGIKRRTGVDAEGVVPAVSNPGSWGERYPRLAERLTCPVFDDGTVRVTDTLTLFAQDGVWKGCLRDRDARLCLWVAATTPEGVLEVLEEALGDATAVWRADRAAGAPEASRMRRRNSS